MSYDPNNPPAFTCLMCGFIILATILGMAHAGYQQWKEAREDARAEMVAETLEAEYYATHAE